MERLGITDIQEFLTENLHFLSCQTKADPFIQYLRSRMVLSRDDQEHIYAVTTSRDRSAKLIDTVMCAGEKGFLAYMEVLEWVYPEAFTKVTGLPATKPPKDFGISHTDLRASRTSVLLIQELNKCMGFFLSNNMGQKINIEQLNNTVHELEQENEIMISDIANLETKLRKYEDDMDEYETSQRKLQQKIKAAEEENKTLAAKLDEKNEELVRLEKLTMNGHDTSLHDPVIQTNNLTDRGKEAEAFSQLLELNRRLKEDLKAANEEKERLLGTMGEQKENLRESRSWGLLERKGAVKIKKELNSEA